MRRIGLIAVLAFGVAAAPAAAIDYPGQGNPGGVATPPKGPHKTLRVCKKGHSGKGRHKRYRTIQKAVDKAKAGDTIKVCNGVYHEGVTISGAKKRSLRLIGNRRKPQKVVIESQGLKGDAAQNSLLIRGADNVTVEGFYARHYKGNGFFVVDVVGYRLAHLLAGYGGTYGVFAFNSKGGTITRSEGFYNSDSGFYVGQTPRQAKPLRTRVTHVESWGNEVGFSGSNMRYVTISRSRWFNNGLGIVPNGLQSEKYPPEEDNVISDNDVFWNNFDYYKASPFKVKTTDALEGLTYPIGTGILLLGGHRNVVAGNRIWGNWLVGAGAVEQVVMLTDDKLPKKIRESGHLVGNEVRGNTFGAGGADLNGRDLWYDGEGHDNCVDPNQPGVLVTMPTDRSTMGSCPFSGANVYSAATLSEGVGWVTASNHQASWLRHPHKPIKGIEPLVVCTLRQGRCQRQPKR